MQTSGRQQEEQTPWWNALPDQVGGDVIVANIGDGAQGVAVGKNIQQTVTLLLGAPTPDDEKIIEQQFLDVKAALAKARSELDATTATMAEFQLKLLQGELGKTKEAESPSASTIVQVGDWLLDNVPEIAEAVVSLFASPAVGKVVGKAGEVAINWAKQRFGKTSTTPQP